MSISNETRGRIKQVFEPIALGLGRLGLTPDGLTLIGFGITVVGAAFLAGQLWLAGGIVVFLGGVFDMFDGTLARATGRVSPLGAFMDSVFDRLGEGIVYLGIVVGTVALNFDEAAILATAAMGAAFMVSYTRSKSEGLGFTAGTRMGAVGVMPREVRLVILCFGLIVMGVLGSPILQPVNGVSCVESCVQPGGLVLVGVLGIIAGGSIVTVIQRILHVRSQARSATSPTIH
jgi:CDP-diacylglycerol---glycerol-3-phosphate 3-phosphatidyltransferase